MLLSICKSLLKDSHCSWSWLSKWTISGCTEKQFHIMRKHLHYQQEVWALMLVLHIHTTYRYLKWSFCLLYFVCCYMQNRDVPYVLPWKCGFIILLEWIGCYDFDLKKAALAWEWLLLTFTGFYYFWEE